MCRRAFRLDTLLERRAALPSRSRFWDVADEHHFFRRERFAEMGGERVF
jgi:hypothetical protein